MSEHRIVSLLPSATEIVVALGLKDCLVGRSHECDFPAGLEHLPICCEPTIDVSASSGEINSQVEERLANAVSIYRLDTEKIAELRPTHILTQMQCEVCAVSENDVRATVEKLADSKPQVLSLSPSCLTDLWQTVRDVASALDVAEKGGWWEARSHWHDTWVTLGCGSGGAQQGGRQRYCDGTERRSAAQVP